MTVSQQQEPAQATEVEPAKDELPSAEDQIQLLKDKARDWIVPYSELKFGQLLGKGSQGEVFKAEWRGSIIAVKKVDIRNVGPDIVEEFCAEADIMRRLRHPSLCMFMGVCVEFPHLCILTECVARGSLFDLLHDECIPISWNLILRMATDIAEGMNYLHCYQPMIVHRDLKSLNLLVDENWRVKIIDFGMTRFEDANASMTQCGSPLWMSPEMIMSEPYNEKIDVYSFGICLWELYTRRIPYRSLDITPQVLVARVVQENLRPTIPKHSPPELTNLMSTCWNPDPKLRPSFAQILDSLHDMKSRGVIPIVGGAAQKPAKSLTAPTRQFSLMPGSTTSENGRMGSWFLDFNEFHFDSASECRWRGKPVSVQRWSSKVGPHVRNALHNLETPRDKDNKVSSGNPHGVAGVQLFERLANLRHPNLLLFMGAYFEDNEVGLVFQNTNGDPLNELLLDASHVMDWDIQLQLLIDIALGISYLHSSQPPIYHRYITSKSILVDFNHFVKITDYGIDELRAFLGDTNSLAIPEVLPPEWIQKKEQGKPFVAGVEVDIFCFGTIMWEVLTRRDATGLRGRKSIPPSVEPTFADLISQCWNDEPTKRPKISKLLAILETLKVEGPPRIELSSSNAKRYQKKKVVVAYQSKDPITIVKAWGKSKGRANAYVIVGAGDDVYCCDEDIFNATYQPVRDKPNCYRKLGTVLALKMNRPFSVKTITGTIEHGAEGDFLVQNEAKEQWPIEMSQFNDLYEETATATKS